MTADTDSAWPPPADDDRWQQLRAPFDPADLEWLPKQLQRDDRDRGHCSQPRRGVCADDRPCGGRHARAIHLAYVGHAGITDRLNAVDPTWSWSPVASTPDGLPLIAGGSLWIRLTVLGVERLAVGDAGGKTGPDAVKETIGDALRNGAMRFGVGSYLWSKSPRATALRDGSAPLDDHADPVDPDPVAAEIAEAKATLWTDLQDRGLSPGEARSAVGTALHLLDATPDTATLAQWREIAARLTGTADATAGAAVRPAEGSDVPEPAPAADRAETPRPAPAAADPGPTLASDRQLRTLGARFGRFGITTTDERLDYVTELTGRTLASSRELHAAECSALLDTLGNLLGAAGGRPPTYADTDTAAARTSLEELITRRAADGGTR